jgi:hypothetical protein
MTTIHITNTEETDKNMTILISRHSQMMTDVNRAFLLFCTSKVNHYLMYNNSHGALYFARIAALSAFYTLNRDTDPHYMQIWMNLEYSLIFAQKIMPPELYNEMHRLVIILKSKQMPKDAVKKDYQID